MICSLFPAINAAAKFYKDQHCNSKEEDGTTQTTIYAATYNHFRSEKGIELVQRGLAATKKKEDHRREK